MPNHLPASLKVVDFELPATQISAVIDAIGQKEFCALLADLCQISSGYDRTVITAYFPEHPPVEVYHNLSAEESRKTMAPYFEYAYFLDPLYQYYCNTKGDQDVVVALSNVAPDAFEETQYYKTFYARISALDEVTLFIFFAKKACLSISLANQNHATNSVENLQKLLPILGSVARRHWISLDPNSTQGTGRMAAVLKKSFEQFGTSRLSQRESQIAQLVLQGLPTKVISNKLDVSPETVKVHRKNIYQKLEVASQGELFSMYMNAVAQMPPNSTSDPLEFLDRHSENMIPI